MLLLAKQRCNNSSLVMITATPYFLSRLHGNHLKGTFNSYLSLTYTGVNFLSLAYATATASTSDSNSRIRTSASVIALSNMLLALSPILPIEGLAFFTFAIFNGMLQACAGSFLQSAVVGLTSLFGPGALAAMFTGQAVVGVCVSVVQYASAATSSWFPPPLSKAAESTNLSIFAFVFFGLASGSMILSITIHSYLRHLPLYHTIVDPVGQQNRTTLRDEVRDGDGLEDEPFLSPGVEPRAPPSIKIRRVAKMNALYNFTLAWDFIVTLASICPGILMATTDVHVGRQCSLLLRAPLRLSIRARHPHFSPRFCSCHFTSSYSTLATGLGGICAHSPDVSSGCQSAWPLSL